MTGSYEHAPHGIVVPLELKFTVASRVRMSLSVALAAVGLRTLAQRVVYPLNVKVRMGNGPWRPTVIDPPGFDQ